MQRMVVIMSVLAAWAIGSQGWAQPAQLPAATRTGMTPTLHERATAAGGRVSEALEPGDLPMANLAELARRSPVVIVAYVMGLRSQLAQDHQGVHTEVALRVVESVKGTVRGGAIVYARMPGGAHRFDDGQTARQTVPGFRTVQPEATYVLFLRPIRVSPPVRTASPGGASGRVYRAQYELAAGLQGVFQLDFAGGTVVPAAVSPDHPLAAGYGTTTVVDFLTELHQSFVR